MRVGWIGAAAGLMWWCGWAGAQPAPAAAGDPVGETLRWVLRDAAPPGSEGEPSPGLVAFEGAAADASARSARALVRPALAARLGVQLGELDPALRPAVVEFLAAHEDVAADIAFAIGAHDKAGEAYGVLARLIAAHGERVAELSPLAAAICVVHDQPQPRRVNENRVPPIDAVELFGYFASHEREMRTPLGELPPSLLVYIADANGTVDQLGWALSRYGDDPRLGARYHEIRYDYGHFREGTAKAVTASGAYTLPSILEHGGVCADQAYFAMSVGKASGVPACYVRGRGGDVSHAWLGFLEPDGRAWRWNFTAGRYSGYEDVRGSVEDPQTRRTVPDAFLSARAMSASRPREVRQQSMALLDAALARAPAGAGAPDRHAIREQLDLLEGALRLDAGNLGAWALACRILGAEGSTNQLKHHWAVAIDQMAGSTTPDFAFEIMRPIFESERDLQRRHELWGWAAARYRDRPDLVALAELEQARLISEHGDKDGALRAAYAVFERHPTVGPVTIEALDFAESLLTELGRLEEAARMYEFAWAKIPEPRREAMNFFRQTSWFQVGERYAAALAALGKTAEAAAVQGRILGTP